MIEILWPVTEAEKSKPKQKGNAPLSKDDKKFIKDHTTKKDDEKSGGGGGDDFNSKHPRAAPGTAAGGQFAPASSGDSKKDDKKQEKGKGDTLARGRGKLTDAGKKDGGPGLAYKAGYGKKGGDAQVKGLQSKLNKLGLTDAAGKPLAVDGMLGPKTTAAIKKAQKKLGMKPTGKADGAFLSKLKASGSKTKESSKGKLSQMKLGNGKTKQPVKRPPPGKTADGKRPPGKTDKRPLAGSAGAGTRKGAKYE